MNSSLSFFVIYSERQINVPDDTVRAAAEKTYYFPRVYPYHFYLKAWFVQSTKLVLAVTGRRGAEPAAEDLPCGRLGEEPTKNLARGALSVDALFEWP